ncbi:hypothetical protein DPEC_G00311850 [Dallia pectoralis]|uniref:Uncharacterized protein n=1 Tax=Dallia pectoralis TaxID=75939 RepID=A0ACC2FBE9_DALPE|nr:hypothetical protein DPEC_G00311850 [Dallia pectoralis]
MERLQRSTLYKMAENGGKGVPDILNIIRAHHLSNLVKTFNKPDRKASFFERHYATPILRTLGMGTIDHTVPYSWDPPKIYKAIRDFAFGSGLSAAGLASWKYTDIMGHIRSKDTVAPLRASSTVAPQQAGLGLVCSLNRLLTLPRLMTENILNGPPGGCTTTELRQQWRIIGVVKQVLWETRNIKVFNKTTVDPTTLRRRITILLRDHAITEFQKDPVTARAAWGPPAYQPHQRNAPGGMTPPPQPHHPSTGRGVEEGPTLDLHPEWRFTGPAPPPAPPQHPEEAWRRDPH